MQVQVLLLILKLKKKKSISKNKTHAINYFITKEMMRLKEATAVFLGINKEFVKYFLNTSFNFLEVGF